MQAFGGRGLSPSLSLSEGWRRRAHVVLEVFVGLRGEEEFHGFGVTFGRGVHERRLPSLKERTERERGHEERGRGQTTRTHTRRG